MRYGCGREPGLHLLLWTLLALATVATAATQAPLELEKLTRLGATDVKLQAVAKGFDRTKKESVYELALTNVSADVLHGPVYVTIEGLNATPGITLRNADGTTTNGLPYVIASAGDIARDALVTRPLFFSNPTNVRFSFATTAYATPGAQRPPLAVEITSPATLITVGSGPLPVDGTINDASATLTVNGVPIGHDGRMFHANVALSEGHNAIVARATNARGEEATATISVSLDMTPPYVTIESPLDGAVLHENLLNVSGLINDIVRGTVSEGQAQVTVNGRVASVANRSYLATGVALQEGVNTIRVEGADQVGNVGHAEIHVSYVVPLGARLEIESGQNQRTQIRQVLADSLSVRLLDANNVPAAGKPVVFRVSQGDGAVGVGRVDAGQAVLVTSNADGIARTDYRLGARAGVGNQRVTARAVGFEGEAVFVASATPNAGDKVSVNSGNNQRGIPRQPLPLPFVVVVTDDGANVIEGARVEFEVIVGGGTFQSGATRIIATTDSDGRASAKLTLGDTLGLDVHRVTATLIDTDLTAGFTASALQSGPPGQTSISGVVLDNQDRPLPNVTLRVENTTREARTDAQGRFRVTEVPVGPVHLIADGSTTIVAGEWPTLPYNLVTVAGADNPLASPVYLVKLDTVHAVTVGAEDKEVTLPEVPGFKLTVKAGSVTFPNSDHVGRLSVTPVNVSKIPMPPPNGAQPQFIVTIQPTGARFDPPAALQLPNVDGHPAGAQIDLYSFDHDLEEFVSIGLGTVSADGTAIVSNPGVGVIKAGWHGGSPPDGNGCAQSCGPCTIPDGRCNCVVPPQGLLAGPQCGPGGPPQCVPELNLPSDCKKSVCQTASGLPVDVPANEPPEDLCKRCSGTQIQDARLDRVVAKAGSNDLPQTYVRLNGQEFPRIDFEAKVTSDCQVTEYDWDFGDGSHDDHRVTSHRYASGGKYLAKVTVRCSGCDRLQPVVSNAIEINVLDITHTTSDTAPPQPGKPSGPHRNELGVGEQLTLTVTGPPLGMRWTLTGQGTLLQAEGEQSAIYSAPDVGSTEILTLTDPTGVFSPIELTFPVFAPNSLAFQKIGEVPIAPPSHGALMHLKGTVRALDDQGKARAVSFKHLGVTDVSVAPTNKTGFFNSAFPHVLSNSRRLATFMAVSDANEIVIPTGVEPITVGIESDDFLEPPPWTDGTFDYAVTWRYRVDLAPTSHDFAVVKQTIEMRGRHGGNDDAGAVSVIQDDPCASHLPTGAYSPTCLFGP